MEKTPEIFKKITNKEERNSLFKDLIENKIEILCKANSDQVFKLFALTTDNQSLVLTPQAQPLEIKDKEPLVIHFTINGEKYFLHTEASIKSLNIHIAKTADLFHLQRRQNFRLAIPINYTADAIIQRLNNISLNKSFRIRDLSATGCRLINVSTSFKIDDQIEISLKLGKRESLNLQAHVVYAQPDPANKNYYMVGIEFQNLNTKLEDKLFSVTMELYKEIFSKWEK